MEEILARAVQVFLALAGGYLIVLWFALVVWTYRDIGSRSQSVVTQIFATLLSLLFFVPGTLLYMLMRPRNTLDEAFQRSLEEEYLLQDLEETALCPSCQRQVSDDYLLCPHCQASLKQPCSSCSQLIKISWPVCPYCGSDQSEQALSIRERVEPPDERFLERGSRTFRQVAAPVIREVAPPEPALDHGYPPELPDSGLEQALGPENSAADSGPEESAPIKLFDRKRTRAKKQKSESARSSGSTAKETERVSAELEDSVVEDAAVISSFVTNGNGNGKHPHTDAEPPAPEADTVTEESETNPDEIVAKTTTYR